MNICFLLGKIISEPSFDFLYKCKNVSISSFCLKTRNGNIVQIFGYDEIADFLYSHLEFMMMFLLRGISLLVNIIFVLIL